jgi:hypothetical protein
MAHLHMPRGNATAWVSMPRHRSPPIRPGENNPRPDHGTKILRSGKLSRARHTSPPGKGGEAGLQNDRQPVPATTRTRLHLPSRKPTFQEVQNQPGQIEASDLASILTPKSSLQKKQKNTLFRSDTTDPILRSARSSARARWLRLCRMRYGVLRVGCGDARELGCSDAGIGMW